MANHTGVEGTVKVGTNFIQELRSFSYKESADIIECTTINDTSKRYKSGIKSWDGEFSCFFDENDTTGQGALVIGAVVSLKMYPEGASSGDVYRYGDAHIVNVSVSIPTGGMIERSYTVTGDGELFTSTEA